jgi:peroxiredoxin
MRALFLLALFQAAHGEPLRSGCSADDQQIGSINPTDRVQVESALAGDHLTCYKINLNRSGERLTGYVLGESLPAIAVFVHRREKVSEESAKVEARLALEAARAKTPSVAEPTAPTDPLVSTQFEEFNGRDDLGKPVSLSGLKGRVTVVTFWAPSNPKTILSLSHVEPLYNQFHKLGLAAVGVSVGPNSGHITEALDDNTVPWPQMADRTGLAARYNVDPKVGKTFVLDASHRIVAAGPMGPDIVKAVRQLMDTPPATSALASAPKSGN